MTLPRKLCKVVLLFLQSVFHSAKEHHFFLEKVVFIVLHFGVEADPPNIDMFQVNNRNNGKRCEIYSKLKNKNTRTTKSILLRDWIFKSMFVDQ